MIIWIFDDKLPIGACTPERYQAIRFLEEAEVKARLIKKLCSEYGDLSPDDLMEPNFTDVFLSAAIRYISANAKDQIADHLEEISKIDKHASVVLDRGLSAREAWRKVAGIGEKDDHDDRDLYAFHEAAEAVLQAVRTSKGG